MTKTMTVGKLIQELETCPQDNEVRLSVERTPSQPRLPGQIIVEVRPSGEPAPEGIRNGIVLIREMPQP